MKTKIFMLFMSILLLNGCTTGNDYWGDSRSDVFGAKNCAGNTGRWIANNHAQGGYYCTDPQCKMHDSVSCSGAYKNQ